MGAHIMLTFGTTLGRTRTLRINNADTSASDVSVRNTMDRIISSQAVISQATGLANAVRRATLVETSVIPIALGI